MKRLAVAALALCALSGALCAQAPADPLDAVLALLAAHRHGHVSFTETHEMAMLKEPLISSGELVYEAPEHLEKRTLQPRPETLILDHGTLTVRRGGRTRAVELAAYPQAIPFVESIRATLAGDRTALERYFTLAFHGDLEHWQLTLTPKDAAIKQSVSRIEITGERDAIASVDITQQDGDHSRIRIGAELP